VTLIKKYGNRRLYDTGESRYITLEELADKIRGGEDARVVDAKSGADLTQVTFAQIILESRGGAKLLPVGVLARLIRMRDDVLSEFFGRYLSTALEMYLQARRGAQSFFPFPYMNPYMETPMVAEAPPPRDDVADLRRELDELKKSMRKKKRR
jgi:polyhydroxyalkanoate synthesis repressor PhaR